MRGHHKGDGFWGYLGLFWILEILGEEKEQKQFEKAMEREDNDEHDGQD